MGGSGGNGGAAFGGDGDGDTATGDGDTATGDGDTATGDGDTATGDGDTATGDGGMTTGDVDASIGDWVIPDELKLCNGEPCQCANGIDDDGDGEVDGFDAECSGPNDDDEGSFATGIPGDNKDNARPDCFFDGDSGAGNDKCDYNKDCLSGALPQTDEACELSEECIAFCAPRTPNGCDCFGCCSFTTDGGDSMDVYIGSGPDCTAETLDQCDTCVKKDSCNNECGECELCPGKTLDDLPASCWPESGGDGDGDGDGDGTGSGDGDGDGTGSPTDPPPFTCDNGATACWDNSGCDGGYYCSLGCCLLIPPK